MMMITKKSSIIMANYNDNDNHHHDYSIIRPILHSF